MPPKSRRKIDLRDLTLQQQVIASMFYAPDSVLHRHQGKTGKISELFQDPATRRAADRIAQYLHDKYPSELRGSQGEGIKWAVSKEWTLLERKENDRWKALVMDFLIPVWNHMRNAGGSLGGQIERAADGWLRLNDSKWRDEGPRDPVDSHSTGERREGTYLSPREQVELRSDYNDRGKTKTKGAKRKIQPKESPSTQPVKEQKLEESEESTDESEEIEPEAPSQPIPAERKAEFATPTVPASRKKAVGLKFEQQSKKALNAAAKKARQAAQEAARQSKLVAQSRTAAVESKQEAKQLEEARSGARPRDNLARDLSRTTPPGRSSKAVKLGQKDKKALKVAKIKARQAAQESRRAAADGVAQGTPVQTVVDDYPAHADSTDIPAGQVYGDNPLPISTQKKNTSAPVDPRQHHPATQNSQPTVQTPSNPLLNQQAAQQAKPLRQPDKKVVFQAPTDEKGVTIDTTGLVGPMIEGPDVHANMTATLQNLLGELKAASRLAVEGKGVAYTDDGAALKAIRGILAGGSDKKRNIDAIQTELKRLSAPTRAALMVMMTSPQRYSQGFHADLRYAARSLSSSSVPSRDIVYALSNEDPHPELARHRTGTGPSSVNIRQAIPDIKSAESGDLDPAQTQALHETVQDETVQAMQAAREGLDIGLMGIAVRAASVFQAFMGYWAASSLLAKGATVASVAAGVTPLGWAAIAASLAIDVAITSEIISNWNPKKPAPVFQPNNPSANQSGQRAPDSSAYPSTPQGDPPQSAGGQASGDVPMPPGPRVVAPLTATNNQAVMPTRAVGEVQAFLNRLWDKKVIVQGHIQDGQRLLATAKRLNEQYGISENAVKAWAKAKELSANAATVAATAAGTAASGKGILPGQRPEPPIVDTHMDTGDDVNMGPVDRPEDDPTRASISHDTARLREPVVAPPTSSTTTTPPSSAPPATPPRGYSAPLPRPPAPHVGADTGEQGRFAPVLQERIRHHTVVFIDSKGRPFTNNQGLSSRPLSTPLDAPTEGEFTRHLHTNTVYYHQGISQKLIDGQPYFYIDGWWVRGVVRDPVEVQREISRTGVYAEKNGLFDMKKIGSTKMRATKDETDQIKAVAGTAQEEDAKKGIPAIPPPGEPRRPTPVDSGPSPITHPAHGKDKKVPVSGGKLPDLDKKYPRDPSERTKGGKGEIKGGPPIATPPVGGEVPGRNKAQEYLTPDQEAQRDKEAKEDYIPPELRGLVKKLTTPIQKNETGDEVLGKKGQTGLLRPEFIEGGANFVGEVNQDVTLNVIQNLQWQNFNNRDNWEPNEYFDNPLYKMELAQTGERFGGHLFGEEDLAAQETASRYAIRHMNPRINAFRDVPADIQFQARNIFMAVQPYEGQAAKSDSDQEGFKTSVETNYEFHDVFLPCGFNFPSTGPLERFTEADGTQFPDSARLGGYELSLHDAEPLQNVNNWIATTST